MIRLEFPDKLPSWNDFFGRKHWTHRKALNKKWMWLLLEAHPRKSPLNFPVDITVTVYGTLPMDCDNVCFKPLLDAMIGRLVKDDDPRWVKSVKLISLKGKDKTVVELTENSGF